MRLFFILLFLYLSISSSFASDCNITIDFKSPPIISENTHKVSENISILRKNYLSYQNENGAKLATNVNCQLLIGEQYQANEKEWQNILKTNFTELSRQGYQKVKLTPLEGEDKFFNGKQEHREYRFDVTKEDDTQVFYVVNILNEKNTILYSIMISGDSSITQKIQKEYQRVLISFIL